MKALVRKTLSKLGYEVSRKSMDVEVDRIAQLCKEHKIPTLESMPLPSYRAYCAPLFPVPTKVPEKTLQHYKSMESALQNESMETYFKVNSSSDGFMLTDDYPESHYFSRQRMLASIYEKWGGDQFKKWSVLDVGCSSGYYSFHCAKLGAASVQGIDARPEHADQFRLLHGMLGLGSNCSYTHVDVETELERLESGYDLVLAQGIMYHVYDHPRFIQNLYRLTKNVLVLEGGCSGRGDLLCKPEIEDATFLRASIHGPVLYPSVAWIVELMRWVGFRDVTYVMLPEGVPDRWGFAGLWRTMLVAKKG